MIVILKVKNVDDEDVVHNGDDNDTVKMILLMVKMKCLGN